MAHVSELPQVEKRRVANAVSYLLAKDERIFPGNHIATYSVSRDDNKYPPLRIFHYETKDIDSTYYKLFAVDNQGQLAGVSSVAVEGSNIFDKFTARGNIEVFNRQSGVASALETVKHLLLQRQSSTDSLHRPIEYWVDDVNSKRLKESRIDLKNARRRRNSEQRVEELEDYIQMATNDRRALLSLYSAGAKLGFQMTSNGLIKTILPGGQEAYNGYNMREISDELNTRDALLLLSTQLRMIP